MAARNKDGLDDLDNWDLFGDGNSAVDPFAGVDWSQWSNPDWGLGSHDGDTPDPATNPGGWGGDPNAGAPSNFNIGSILRFLGLGGNSGGGSGGGGTLGSLGSLLPLLALGGSSIFQNQNTGQATQQMLDANRRAEDLVTSRMNGPSPFLPYTDQGREGVWNMQAMGPRALAGNYQPLGSGRGKK